MSLSNFNKAKKENQILEMSGRSNPDVCDISNELLISEFKNGVAIADNCMIEELSTVFSLKRGFQNAFTGYPNDGKTQFLLFLMTVKSLRSDWKWVFWSPEMKSASFVNGKVEVHYNDLINEIVQIVSGKTVYKHIHEKYKIERIQMTQYLEIVDWVKKHFICLDPVDNHIDHIYNTLSNIYNKQGFDGILIDPFKNVKLDDGGRDDQKLDVLFSKFKDLAVTTNTVMNWIAHPKANIQKERDGQRMPCDQYMLLGGASWDNNMDGIYSIFRQNLGTDPKSRDVTFLNLKQRKQELTTERGNYSDIYFDTRTRRYIFGGRDVIQFKKIEQEEVPF